MARKVKICGLTDEAAVSAAVEAGASYVGYVFFPPSPRHVSPEKAAFLHRAKGGSVPAVAVTVDADDALLGEIMHALNPAYLQLHGNESAARAQDIKKRWGVKIIRAFKVSSGDDIARAHAFEDVADHLLFDAKPPKLPGMLPGGNGLSFDWALLAGRSFKKPWFLSGGLNAENLAKAVAQSGATMLDVSSSVESAPGVKDARLIRELMDAAKAF